MISASESTNRSQQNCQLADRTAYPIVDCLTIGPAIRQEGCKVISFEKISDRWSLAKQGNLAVSRATTGRCSFPGKTLQSSWVFQAFNPHGLMARFGTTPWKAQAGLRPSGRNAINSAPETSHVNVLLRQTGKGLRRNVALLRFSAHKRSGREIELISQGLILLEKGLAKRSHRTIHP